MAKKQTLNPTKNQADSIDSLVFDDKNFNKHTAQGMQMLEQSIQRNGFGRSVLCDKNNVLIGGNGVVETATRLGKTKIRFVETDGDELVVVKRNDIDINTTAGREMALADNVTAAIDLDWDEDMMREVQSEVDIEFEDWGLDLPPLDDSADDSSSTSGSSDTTSSDLPSSTASPSSQSASRPFEHKASIGDIWELGSHRIMCALPSADSLCALMLDNRASLLFSHYDKVQDTLSLVFPHLVEGAPFYLWATSENMLGCDLSQTGLSFSSTLVWVKNEAHVSRKDYASKYQPCLYGWKPGAARRWYGDNKANDVLSYPALPLGTNDIFRLPIEMNEYLFDNSSLRGDIILDPSGDGSTLVAASKTDRRAYMLTPSPETLDTLIAIYLNFCAKDGDSDVYLIKSDGTRVPYSEVETKK